MKSDLLPKASYLFTRIIPRETDPVTGFYVILHPKESLRINSSGKFWERGGASNYVDAKFHSSGWEVRYKTRTGQTFFIDLGSLDCDLDPREFDVRNLQQRKAIGCIGVTFTFREDKNDEKVGLPIASLIPELIGQNLYLIVGFEPLPSNPLGTPPGYVKPWYSFEYGASERSVLREFTPQDGLCLYTSDSRHPPVGIRFTATTNMFKTFYRISLASRKGLE